MDPPYLSLLLAFVNHERALHETRILKDRTGPKPNNRCLSNWATVVCQKEDLSTHWISLYLSYPQCRRKTEAQTPLSPGKEWTSVLFIVVYSCEVAVLIGFTPDTDDLMTLGGRVLHYRVLADTALPAVPNRVVAGVSGRRVGHCSVPHCHLPTRQSSVQRYLTDKRTHPPRTLSWAHA